MPAKKQPPPKARRESDGNPTPAAPEAVLFDRVAGIIEQARGNIVRAVNRNMVMAYWLIGQEIVQEIQQGKGRAEYGRQVLGDLARRLTERFGEGFSETSLKYFRTFYLAYADHPIRIGRPMGDEFRSSPAAPPNRRPMGDESGLSDPTLEMRYPAGSELALVFSPQLAWSHYRALMRVENPEAREFYEREAISGAWDKRTLERQIHSSYYERLLKSQTPEKMLAEGRRTLASPHPAIETLKNPYVLEFLSLPEVAALQESGLEQGILTSLQAFLLELGKGFAFVARQKRVRFEEEDRYVDLVFYHIQLRFYLLIDLKIGKLTHGDVGQMDGYVRMFDDLCVMEGDNPTIGLILCTEKDEVVAKYSVLKDRKQIFASKYMLYLPTEEELRRELERERRLIAAHRDFPESEIQAAPDLPAPGRKKSLKSQLEKGSSHGKA